MVDYHWYNQIALSGLRDYIVAREKSHESYLAYFQAGADRYLLRHETANADHYKNCIHRDVT